jgi:hypothetical protein
MPGIPTIVMLFQYLAADPSKDDEVLRQAVTLIGDLTKNLPSDPQLLQQLNHDFVARLIDDARTSQDPSLQEAAAYAREHMQQLILANNNINNQGSTTAM